jgi:hypothetical protein
MPNGANTALTLQRALAAVALVLVLGFAPVACAAMVSQPQADSHPCCPKPGHADSNPCAKTGCVSSVPALRAAPIDSGLGVPALFQTEDIPALPTFISEHLSDTAFRITTPELFLRNHSLLI